MNERKKEATPEQQEELRTPTGRKREQKIYCHRLQGKWPIKWNKNKPL